MEIKVNEWTKFMDRRPPVDRELLVAYADGRKQTLKWDGRYWYEPSTHVRQQYTQGHSPVWWYMFEKLEINGRM